MKAFISPHWITITLPVQPVTHKNMYEDIKISADNRIKINKYLSDLVPVGSYADYMQVRNRSMYKDCRTFLDLVNVYTDGIANNNGTVCLEFTGDALETFALDIAQIGKYALDRGGNVCRVDVQCLDTGNYIPYKQLLKCCSAKYFKERVRTHWNRGNKITDLPKIETQPYRKITFGSPKSDNYLVIYDRQQTEELDCKNNGFDQNNAHLELILSRAWRDFATANEDVFITAALPKLIQELTK